MSEDEFLTEEWVLKFLGWERKTLLNKKYSNGDIPPSIEKGNITRYPKKEFFQWYTADLKVPKRKRTA